MKNRQLLGFVLILVGGTTGYMITRLSVAPGAAAAPRMAAEAPPRLTALDPLAGDGSYFDQRLALEGEFLRAGSHGARRAALDRMRRRGMDT
ncbi:MAG: hypothetical protein ACR2RV_15455, partial [Verrucomicrobiales bacterium]